jgi:hypothetical protein
MLFFASGRVEGTVSFGCCGGNAATTTEKDGHFLAAVATTNAFFRLRQGGRTVLIRLILRRSRKINRKR